MFFRVLFENGLCGCLFIWNLRDIYIIFFLNFCRTVEEFSAGHAVGAVNVPYMFKIGAGMFGICGKCCWCSLIRHFLLLNGVQIIMCEPFSFA